MKTTVLLLSLLCLLAMVHTYPTGMGYPQDMFAEHFMRKELGVAPLIKDTAKEGERVIPKAVVPSHLQQPNHLFQLFARPVLKKVSSTQLY